MNFAFRIPPSGYALEAPNDGDTIVWDAALSLWGFGVAGAVLSVFGRTGAVVAVTGDYDSDQIDNVSGVAGATVSDALDTLAAGGGAVSSVFGRTGAVVAVAGDYDSDEIDNAAASVPGTTVSDALDNLGPPEARSGSALADADATIATTVRLVLLPGTLTLDRDLEITPSTFPGKFFYIDVGTQGAGLDLGIANGGLAGGSVGATGVITPADCPCRVFCTSDGSNVVFMVEELDAEPVL